MYLLTLFGISSSFYTRSYEQLFQGLIQGNRAVSLRFFLIVVLLIRSLYQADLIKESSSSISKVIYYLIGKIFIDDSDLNIMNDGTEDEVQIVQRAQ